MSHVCQNVVPRPITASRSHHARLLLSVIGVVLALLLVGCGTSRPASSTAPQMPTEPGLMPLTDADPVDTAAAIRRMPQKAAVPHAADDDVMLRFAVVADLNGRYGSKKYNKYVHRAVRRLIELQPDLVLSAGDMVAGQRDRLDYRGMWRAFHDAVTDPLRRAGLPFAVTPGNHDASAYPKHAKERSIFRDEWRQRRPRLDYVDDEYYPLYYAFVKGPVLFIALDATKRGPIARKQREWVERVLTKHSNYPVKVAFGHLPLVPFAGGKSFREALNDTRLEQVFEKQGVDLYISGHHQAYFPGRRGNLRLVGVSCLGGGPRPLVGEEDVSDRSFLMVEVTRTHIRTIEALQAPDFKTPIPRQALPVALGDLNPWVWRDDASTRDMLTHPIRHWVKQVHDAQVDADADANAGDLMAQ